MHVAEIAICEPPGAGVHVFAALRDNLKGRLHLVPFFQPKLGLSRAVELVVSSNRSITSVAKELGLRDSVLRRWVDKFGQEPTSAAWRPTAPPRPCRPADAGPWRQPRPDRADDSAATDRSTTPIAACNTPHAPIVTLSGAGATASMSRKADCYNNAPMEAFFHALKIDLVHHRHYRTRAEAQRDIFTFIEASTTNPAPFRHRNISPIEMELKAAPVHFIGGR